MAAASPSTAGKEQVSGGCRKQVQELSENGDEVPQRYVGRKDTPIDLPVPLASDIPVIDFGRLVTSSASAMDAAELEKLRSALSSWGCFQAINHGIDISLLENLRQVNREFFHLPMIEKQKYARAENDEEGYGNDQLLFENQSLDWNDRLYLIVSPQHHQKLQYWPQNPNSFRDILNDYTGQVRKMQEELLKVMAKSLGLPEDLFLKQFSKWPEIRVRFNLYPTSKRPDLVLGLKPHADGSGITVLLQDKEVQGLQVLKDDQWFEVPVMPHALFVNVGDQLEIMSNGEFKSPVHRVIINANRERNTVAMFYCPDATMEIGPLEELVDGTRPRSFKNVRNYVENYFHYFQQGKRRIDAVRI